MPTPHHLTVALGSFARTRPIIDGTVDIEGVEPTVLDLPAPERHRRMLAHAEFDVCELSMGSYLTSLGRDYPFTAVPAFPYRRFRHGFYYVNADAGIEHPTDLEGKRIGLRRWQNTAALWMRGIAEDYYGADMSTVSWFVDDEDEIPVDVSGTFDVEWLPPDRSVSEMLATGELDALMYPGVPGPVAEGDPRVGRLFDDVDAEERRYYRETGLFPLMHVIVVKDEVVAEAPWLPMSLRKAFERANRRQIDRLEALVAERQSVRWANAALTDEEGRDVLAIERELWADDPAELTAGLESLIRYASRFGLIDEQVEPEALFVESALEDLPHTG